MLVYHMVFVRNWDVNILDVDGICIYTKIHRSMCSCISRMIHWRTLTWDGNAIVADYINKEIPNSIEGKCKLIANSSCLTINPIFWRQKGRQKNLHIIAFSHFRRYQTSTKKKKLHNFISGCRFVPYIHTFSERSRKTDHPSRNSQILWWLHGFGSAACNELTPYLFIMEITGTKLGRRSRHAAKLRWHHIYVGCLELVEEWPPERPL